MSQGVINSLFSNFTISPANEKYIVSTSDYKAVKYGHLICFQCLVQLKSGETITGSDNVILLFPNGYRPTGTVVVNAYDNTNDEPLYALLKLDGTLQIYKNLSSLGISSFRFSGCFAV